MEPSAIEVILTSVSSVVSSAVTWMGSFLSTITSNPLLLLFVIIPFVGLGVGLIRRMIRL